MPSPGEVSFCTCCGRSRCSISQRASIAAEFSSIHWSRRPPISLRRLAAWLRRESSKLCSELREAERRNSQGGSVLQLGTGTSWQKGTQTDHAGEAARRTLRRNAERAAMRNVVDAGRTRETDPLPAGKHFRAVAAPAKAGVRRVRCGEEDAGSGRGAARRRLWNGVGIPAPSRDSQEHAGNSPSQRWREGFAATRGALKGHSRFNGGPISTPCQPEAVR